jgi:hypothetical protein
MLRNFRLRQVVMTALLMPLPVGLSFAQSAPPDQPSVVLEVEHTHVLGYVDTITSRVFSDGRFITEGERWKAAKSGRHRKVFVREETQLEPVEVAELVVLAEQPEFLDARPEYTAGIVRDYPNWVTVTYHKEGREKRVKVINLYRKDILGAGRDTVPPAVLKLIERVNGLP